jgi:DNA repair exonuclease SbcCD ATPase subunit
MIKCSYVCAAAESREESLLLARQLATAKADLQKAKTATSKLSRQLETEQLLRTDAEGAAEALKQRLEKLLGGSQEATKQRAELAEVGGALARLCACVAACPADDVLGHGCVLGDMQRVRGRTHNTRVSGCFLTPAMLKQLLPDVLTREVCGHGKCVDKGSVCALLHVQQLAAAKSDAEELRSEREQLAEVVLEMQVGGEWISVTGTACLVMAIHADSKHASG